MANEDLIYTWRNICDQSRPERSLEVRWIWSGWIHAAKERNHVLEALRIWPLVFGEQLANSLVRAVKSTELKECHSALTQLAGRWQSAIRQTFSRPRILQCSAINQSAGPMTSGTRVILFTTKHGIIFVARHQGNGLFELTTFYFPDRLVHGLAFFQSGFERVAIGELVEQYTESSQNRLPDPNNRKHQVKRRYEVDREIRFLVPTSWGFESDAPGAIWNDVPSDEDPPAATGNLVPIDPPPPQNPELPGEGES